MDRSSRTDELDSPNLKAEVDELTPSTPVEAHGAEIPILGFGTWELQGDTARRMVETALEVGYRHLDTAQTYENEKEVGRALEASGIPRDQVWVTTKVWPDRFPESRFMDSVRRSLDRLRLDAVDLLLLHWPKFENTTLAATLELLSRARRDGLARHVGVSNFTISHLDQAWGAGGEPLVVNQVEYHPFLDQRELLEAVRSRGMALTAYSPIARGEVEGSARLEEIGRRHGKSEEQVALRWLIQQDAVTAIPKTSDEAHCRENLQIFDFHLSDEEMAEIAGLADPQGRLVDPDDLAPNWD